MFFFFKFTIDLKNTVFISVLTLELQIAMKICNKHNIKEYKIKNQHYGKCYYKFYAKF